MSITLRNVSKSYHTRAGLNPILKDISLHIDHGEHVGILGQNGAGKSTLIRVLSGSEQPTSGTVERRMSVSWPLAFGGAFLGGLTGVDNIRFVCRLYGVDPSDKLEFIEDFTELGRYLREPVKSYSSGMRARLAFAVSMAVDFDCYLIDEIVAVGDDRFQRKCQLELFEKRRDKAMLLVSHSADFIRLHCERASVLVAGELTNFTDVGEAYQFYTSHELAIQPHMAVSASLTERREPEPVVLDSAVIEAIIQGCASGDAVDLNDLFQELRILEAPLFDACGLVGRLSQAGSPFAAQALARYLTQKRPTEPLFWVSAGDIFCQLRQHVPGVNAYLKAIELDPASYWGNRNLAMEYFNVGRYADAIPVLEKSAELAPDALHALELQLRAIDCQTLLDRPVAAQSVAALSSSKPLIVVDSAFTALQDGVSARIAIAGLAIDSLDRTALRCTIHVGERSWEGQPSLARSSLRRLAAVSDTQAFAFTLYAAIPANAVAAEIEVTLGGLSLYAGSIPVHFIGTSSADAATALEAARFAHAEHRAAESALHYGRSAQESDEYDIIPFAEDLIAAGLYDEAEERLVHWDGNNANDHEDGGAVLDLLGVESARSRLPGWREKLAGALERETRRNQPTSVLANLGHAKVAGGDLEGAISYYQKAANGHGNGPLIHFARGIYTAQFADEVQSPVPTSAALPDAGEYDMVHLFACDAQYFLRFANTLVRSSNSARIHANVIVHAHIVDADDESIALAEQLASEFGLKYTTEESPRDISNEQVRRAYFTCARFLMAPQLLETYRCPILVTETDCLINWSWDDLIDYVEGVDVGYVRSALWNWVPWTKIPAGIVLYAPTPIGIAWSDYVARFIQHAFKRQGSGDADVWTVDQVALWLAHVAAPKGSKTIHLPMASVLTLATGDKTNIL